MSLRILGDGPIEDALIAAGIADDNTTRVVIDLRVGHFPVVHTERWGDEQLLEVVKTLDGVKVVREDRPPHRKPCTSTPPEPVTLGGVVAHEHQCLHDATDEHDTTLEHQCRCAKKWTTEPSEQATE